MFERAIEALTAISKNYTINELNNSWYYKYLFEVQEIKDMGQNGKSKSYYNHKYINPLRNLLNIV
jgi:hypothetical protein